MPIKPAGSLKFPKPKRKAAPAGVIENPEQRLPEEELSPILGRTPGSREEWRLAMALQYLKIEFDYQVPLGPGGGRWRGGQVIDFVVYIPFPAPVQVYGRYWHSGERGSDDLLKEAVVQQKYGRPVIAIFDDELESIAEAVIISRSRLR